MRSTPVALAQLAGVAMWLSLSLAACQDAVPLEDFPARAQQALCLAQVACGSAPDVPTCEQSVFFGESAGLLTTLAAVNRGTISYDEDRARDCLRDFDRGCLVSVGDAPSSCAGVFRGKVALGGTCVIDGECVEGNCVPALGCVSACCAGQCAAANPVALGGACTTSGPACVDGAFCRAGRCVERLAVGAECVGGDVCQSPARCTTADDDDRGQCVIPAEEGVTCNPSHAVPCLRRYDYCDITARRCLPRQKAGEGCASDTSACVTYAPCRGGVCTLRPTAGDACAGATDAACLGELRCTSGVCTAPTAALACVP